MAVSTAIAAQIAEQERDYNARLADLAAQEKSTKAKYGANAAGQLDFINPQDPFSVTGAMKRLFREQSDEQKYSQFSGGWGFDGSMGSSTAKLQIGQQQKQRDVTDEFNEAVAGVGRSRTELEGQYRGNVASLNAQLAQAFADEQAATLGAAQAAAALPGEAGNPAPGASGTYEYKRAKSAKYGVTYIYRRIKGSGQQWQPVRPA
jgi:hypothetical protein